MATPAELAAEDYAKHKENGVSLNPFSTVGARSEWQRGFDGVPLRSWEGSPEFSPIYQRGAAAAALLKSKKED